MTEGNAMTRNALTLGNPDTPPWPAADGKGDWLSDEANSQAAVTDEKWVCLTALGPWVYWIGGVDTPSIIPMFMKTGHFTSGAKFMVS